MRSHTAGTTWDIPLAIEDRMGSRCRVGYAPPPHCPPRQVGAAAAGVHSIVAELYPLQGVGRHNQVVILSHTVVSDAEAPLLNPRAH